MNFFFDVNMSWRYRKMIAALEEGFHEVVHVTQHPQFAHNNDQYGNSTKDIELLRVLGAEDRGWVFLSGDKSILDTPHERAALIESGLTFLRSRTAGRNFPPPSKPLSW